MEPSYLSPDERLREKNLALYESIYHYRPSTDPDEDDRYRMTAASNGRSVLMFNAGTASEPDWIRAGSIYDPEYEAGRWADSVAIPDGKCVVAMLGFGMGYQLGALSEKLRPDTDYYIYEPMDGAFAFVCAFVDLSRLLNDEHIFIFTASYAEGGYLHHLEDAALKCGKAPVAVRLPFYPPDDFFEDTVTKVKTSISAGVFWQAERGRIALENRLYAWTHLKDNYLLEDLMKRIPVDLPVIVVAGGPSLNRNVDDLKRAKGKALIICVERALSVLTQHDIIPDFVITIDPLKDPAYIENMIHDETKLLCAYQSDIRLQELCNGRLFYCLGWKYDEIIPGLGGKIKKTGDYGRNVAGAAVTLMMQYGMKNIILVGQDLALSDGQSHADGSDVGVMEGEDIEIEGIDGGTVLSHLDWILFRDFYEKLILTFPETSVIDATEGGALIHGSRVMTLSGAIDELCADGCDMKVTESEISHAQTDEQHQKTMQVLSGLCEELDRISKISQNIKTLIESLSKVCRYQDITDRSHAKQTERLNSLWSSIRSTRVWLLMRNMWIEDRSVIPDDQFIFRNNDEAVLVLGEADKFFTELPDICMGLREKVAAQITQSPPRSSP